MYFVKNVFISLVSLYNDVYWILSESSSLMDCVEDINRR